MSLGSSTRFSAALAHVPAENVTLVYADVAGLRDWIESQLGPSTPAYEEYVQPYVAPLDAFVATATVGGDVDRLDAALTVR